MLITERLAAPSQPERITGNEYTIGADVWSMGLSILELVQNRFPFPSDLAPVDLIMHITASEVLSFFFGTFKSHP
jgi:serine/threonine protein kinase